MTPVEPAWSSRELAAELRQHFAEHNRHVLWVALGTIAASAVVWTALYFIAQWLTLLAVTVVGDGTASLPRGFSAVFFAVAGALLIYTWIDRLLTPDSRPRDQKSSGEIAQDVILALPRATLSVWSTLTVRQHLSAAELGQAADLLQRLTAVERLPLAAAGYDLPDSAVRERVLAALEITRVIDVLRGKNETTLSLSTHRPDSLRLTAPSSRA